MNVSRGHIPKGVRNPGPAVRSGERRGLGRALPPLAVTAALVGLFLTTPASGAGGKSEDALIREALSAAPPQVAETATVIDLEGNVLRQGSGEYTCLPAPPGFGGPMCHDEQFMAWMDAFMNGEPAPPTSAIGTSYMLAGDSPDGGASNIDPQARTPTADNQWVVEGPHVMVIVPDPASLKGLPTTPNADGPYVMWPDSPYAHIMWPVAERPAQRPVVD
ncbi:hypothetical protein [Salinisphaera orenii]|uniref:Uncharacterized protein n=1 Tax=Salinisphaera orenii YIM 95161 TaxID=1051139 RepID=A0A423PDX2_9GAMM|nr:hypothetical protein [Salinisphaera halophila]ROO23774.1 hypothetical protein SAHL_16540 [Salinisphaera halophila YIM 95161]